MLECELPGIKKLRSGKVHEIFDLGDSLLVVATDRISVSGRVLPAAIPNKGATITQLSEFWFEALDFVPSHFITANFKVFPEILQPFKGVLFGRSMLVRKTRPLPVACVARGYLAGIAWKEYRTTGSVGGVNLPEGLLQASRLPSAIFTPAIKTADGSDENISWSRCRALIGDEMAHEVRSRAIELYEHGRAKAAAAGIVVADSEFEFGVAEDELLLISECLTPDSSVFWAANDCAPGAAPPSFDKQFVRDYLASIGWNKTDPAPHLPDSVIETTSQKYLEAFERLTGRGLARP